MITLRSLSLVAASCLVVASARGQTVLTFSSLDSAGNGYRFLSSPVYAEGGFQIRASTGFCTQQTPSSGPSDFYAGSTGLANCYANGLNTLTKVGGGTFSLNSIDLAPFAFSYGGNALVSFLGTTNASPLSVSFRTPTKLQFQTFAFTGWDNLTSVSWRHLAPYHQFDNITLDTPAPIVTPEPTTIVLLAFGLLAVAGMRRRGTVFQSRLV